MPASTILVFASDAASGEIINAALSGVGYTVTVATNPDDRRNWWRLLCDWQFPSPETPRSLAGLANSMPGSSFMVVAGPAYLAAISRDLAIAASNLEQRRRFVVLSTGRHRPDSQISDVIQTIDSRLQAAVGGSMISLNVRIARLVIESFAGGELDRAQVGVRLAALTSELPQAPRFDRTKLDDGQVLQFIAGLRARQPDLSATTALRALRNSGLACEQSRFHRLFSAVEISA